MTERATVAQVVQIGAEATNAQGTAVAAGKLLASMELTGGIKAEHEMFRPTGRKYGSFVIPGREWSEWKIGGKATYGELVYPLASVLHSTTPSTDGTLPKLWTFTPGLSAEDTVQTYTVEMGSGVRAHSFAYGIVTELGLKFSHKSGVEYDGVLMGQRIGDGITLTTNPTAIETTPMPIAGTQITISTGTSFAGLASASTIARCLSAEWRIGDRFKPLWVLDATKTSYVAHVEGVPKLAAKILVEADAAGMAFLTAMRAASQQWLRFGCSGPNIESGKPYLFQIDGCYNVKNVSDFRDEEGVYAVEWELEPVYDTTAAKTYEAKVRNLVAAL